MEFDINELFYDDENYTDKAEWCNKNHEYTIVEATPDENGRRRFKFVKQIVTNEQKLISELNNLLHWFEEYDNQVKQYNRCQRMGIAYDKDIEELDSQAKINADRITEIRNLLKNNS